MNEMNGSEPNTGSWQGKLYGTVKVYKPNFQLRPVVSIVITPEFALAKFSENMIKSYLPQTRILNQLITS